VRLTACGPFSGRHFPVNCDKAATTAETAVCYDDDHISGSAMNKLGIAVAAAALSIGTSARAADMAVKAPPLPPAPVYSWTGWYVGLNAGYSWMDPAISIIGIRGPAWDPYFPDPFRDRSFERDGFIGGGQVGSTIKSIILF